MTWFIKILFWVNFEHVITHLEADWFHFWCNIITAVFDVAESLVTCAVKIWESFSPFFSNFIKYIWWNRKLGTSSINNGWILCVFSRLLHWFGTIEHTLSFKCPCSKPVLKVFKCFQTWGSSNNLGWIITTEKCIWCFSHFFWCYTETNHGSVNNTIIFKWP